jgi:benzoyl-CoA 2,3-dioxygenase component A
VSSVLKQHLIDPEICIRCYTCEQTCPIGAIEHDDTNVVVNAEICNHCMDCIGPCPTGSIDEWRVVETPYSLEEQYEWDELPEQQDIATDPKADTSIEALDDDIAALLADAHSGAGGKTRAPASASKPSVNLYKPSAPAVATVQGNYRLTDESSDSDVRHIILDLGQQNFPVLEGQTVGVLAPDGDNTAVARLYSISSPRDGERTGYNNLSLTVKREDKGLCSNYLCNLEKGDKVNLSGPYGSTFLMPNDANCHLLMICTGTGSAPFRAITMHRQRLHPDASGSMTLVFGARTPESLPYFGPLKKVPDSLLKKHLVYSRQPDKPRRYVQDELRDMADGIVTLLKQDTTCIYVCGLRAMEDGVEQALNDIVQAAGMNWQTLRDTMRADGRYHVETY